MALCLSMGDYGWSRDFGTSQGSVAVEDGSFPLSERERLQNSPTRFFFDPGAVAVQRFSCGIPLGSKLSWVLGFRGGSNLDFSRIHHNEIC